MRWKVMRLQLIAAAVLGTLLAGPARAADADAGAKAVKVVVHGGSVSAFRRGGYGQWLAATCAAVDVQNIAKEKLGASALRQRFSDFLRSPSVMPNTQETWLVFLGGANSIGLPELTNLEVARTFKLAHDARFRTMGLTLTPWGSDGDVRWRATTGLEWFAKSQKAVDFVMGRLTPAEAFGAGPKAPKSYLPGHRPEIAVDLWDAALRQRSAALRLRKDVESPVRKSAWVKDRLRGLEGEAREAALEELIVRATELPRWFLRKELIGSDPVHPNSEGHKEIARAICKRAPVSWRCDCSAYDSLVWHEGKRKPVPRKP